MNVQDPPWKQKTRPCPFYSQGRCLFADSCNFLHTVKVKPPEGAPVSTTDAMLPSPPQSPSPRSGTPKTVRFLSPPRSPRLSSLLLALGNAIQQDDEEEEVKELCAFSGSPVGHAADPTLGQDGERQQDEQDSSMMDGYVHEVTPPFVTLPYVQEESLDVTFSPRFSSVEDKDDGEDTITQLRSSQISMSSSAVSASACPFVDDRPQGLLSPIEISSAPPISLPLDHAVQREDSIDSGYADGWTGPSTFLTSPPRSPRRVSTLSILSSPFGSPTSRVLALQHGNSRHPLPPFAALFSPSFAAFPRSHSCRHSDVDDYTSKEISGIADGLFQPPVQSEASALSSPRNQDEGFDESLSFNVDADFTIPKDSSIPEAHNLPSEAELASRGHAHSLAARSTLSAESLTIMPRDYPSLVEQTHQEADDSQSVCLTISDAHAGAPSQETIGDAIQSAVPATNQEELTWSDPSAKLDISDVNGEETASSFCANYYAEVSENEDSPMSHFSALSSPVAGDCTETSFHISDTPPLGPSLISSRPRVFSPPPRFSPSETSAEVRGRPLCSLRSPFQQQSLRTSSAATKRRSQLHEENFSQRGSSLESQGRVWEERTSRKVPFGFRSSVVDRSAGTKLAPGSLPRTRPRPPALAGLSPRSSVTTHPKDAQSLPPNESTPSPSRLKPLRLSMILSSPSSGSALASSSIPPSLTIGTTAFTPSSPTVSSEYSISNNHLLSSRGSSLIPARIRNTLVSNRVLSPPCGNSDKPSLIAPLSAPVSCRSPWQNPSYSRLSSSSLQHLHIDKYFRSESRLSEPAILYEDEEDESERDTTDLDETIRRPVSSLAGPLPRPSSVLRSPVHAIATPRPTLLFALASDNVDEVRRVLESGEAGPNDDVGPQSALAFTLTAKQLSHKMEMVKLLLAYGADPSTVENVGSGQNDGLPSADCERNPSSTGAGSQPLDIDPATRYYIARAGAPQTRRTSALIHRSFFRPLARVRYDLVGQDRVLEQLFRALSMPSMAPIVVLLCGPSGHGKSLLARKFGSLLDVPTHTVNMTTLRSTHDIWRSYSMSPYQVPSTCTLADFLINNEGRRCVVVLDEIEKTDDEKVLSSLLMPWELGRCSFEAGHRHVDVSHVIWLGTSNIGHDLVFEHQSGRSNPDMPMSREEYVDLMGLSRPRVSERLGPSLLSRVTTVLPFVPFTVEEKMAIAAEALHSVAGDIVKTLPPATAEMIVRNSLNTYIPAEGARSLYRSVSTLLFDTI
ncbi:hypothetical protein AcV5_006638 [Taiwanofungus camphoratus]|nr:hypothetical protein AcW2_005072 [Antrodia cinnamomea]KAI0934956.1 hypothetical protein AcV5_006638 [Antrodia cinnamomea]